MPCFRQLWGQRWLDAIALGLQVCMTLPLYLHIIYSALSPIREERVDIVDYLMGEQIVDPNCTDLDGWTPLHYACRQVSYHNITTTPDKQRECTLSNSLPTILIFSHDS